MATEKFGVVLHAGTSDTWTHDALYQEEVEKILKDIAETAGANLRSGAKAIDVVQAVVMSLEDCPFFNAGKGAVLNEDGEHELEAAIVDGARKGFGAVAAIREIKNPIEAARILMDKEQQSFLVGPGADAFARKSGVTMVSNDYFTTASKKAHWESRTCKGPELSDDLETVGAVALDLHGNLAAAGSTGGLSFKINGRVGETAIIGAGLSADENVALVCSGMGEDILRHSVAVRVAASNRTGSFNETMAQVIISKAEKAPSACAIVGINSIGHIAIESSGRVIPTAFCTSSSLTSSVLRTTVPLLSQHIIHRDTLLAAGLTRYPITPGHAVVDCHGVDELMSMPVSTFLKVMHTVRQVSATLISGSITHRCGLACDGSGVISLLPLHDLNQDWEAVIHNEDEYYVTFPGYLTSKNGPKIADTVLEETRSRIAATTGIAESFNNHFDGDASDQNMFARIVRGEIPQWRIWEDEGYIAFLTPFANTPGFTVLVPRKHLGSDIFKLEDEEFSKIIQATHKVAQYLKKAFDVKRCGIFFEGFEIDYAHVKLIPVHNRFTSQRQLFHPIAVSAPFQRSYEGFLTTQFGPLASDLDSIADNARQLRELHSQRTRIVAPKTWQQPSRHSIQALQSPWYAAVFALQDTLFHATISFFQSQLGYKYTLVPLTTDSISSPMGLGSDSQPVHIVLFDQDTYLADSMQFSLEYVLRIEEGLRGAYYVSCSFRGEDTDHMHLNQFYHAECELLGTLNDGIDVAERYIIAVTHAILDKHVDTIRAVAGTTSHVDDLLSLANKNGGRLPRITLSEALSLKEIVDTAHAWDYAVATDHSKGRTLTRTGERILVEKFGGAVWLTEMDHLSVPFYQAFVPQSSKLKALCADLLFGPGEVLGLGQRHMSACEVGEALKMHEVSKDKYEWYLGIRDEEKGGKQLQTTGWGMGMERYLAWIMKHHDIRDMAIIPRMKGMKFAP